MTFALELRKPPSPVRARIWQRELARRAIEATEQDARSLAKEFDVTPGIASGAIAAASLCGGDLTAVRLGVRSLSQVIGGEKPPANQGPPDRFDPILIRADRLPLNKGRTDMPTQWRVHRDELNRQPLAHEEWQRLVNRRRVA